MLKKSFFLLILSAAFLLVTSSAMAATSVSWVSPSEGSNFDAGTLVAPTGQAGSSGCIGSCTGLDLALVIDESGSMGWGSSPGIDAAKSAAIALIDGLPENTTSVAVIGFDSTSHTYRMLTPLNPDKAAVIAAINSIGTGGGTNIGAGVQAGANALVAGNTAGRQMMQVVLSDGIGSYSGQAATAFNDHGIVTHTVGVPGHNATQLQAVAADGNGVYTNVNDLSTLTSIFDGTGGNLVDLNRVDITLADGTKIENIATDGLGNFILPDQVIALGANTFLAEAWGTDGSYASATLTINGAPPVPEPATMFLLGTGLAGLVGVRRKKKIS